MHTTDLDAIKRAVDQAWRRFAGQLPGADKCDVLQDVVLVMLSVQYKDAYLYAYQVVRSILRKYRKKYANLEQCREGHSLTSEIVELAEVVAGSQKEAARRLGVSTRTLRNYKRKKLQVARAKWREGFRERATTAAAVLALSGGDVPSPSVTGDDD